VGGICRAVSGRLQLLTSILGTQLVLGFGLAKERPQWGLHGYAQAAVVSSGFGLALRCSGQE